LLDANLTRHTCRETHFVVSAILLLAVIVCCAAARAEIPPQVKFKPILTNKLEKLGYINDILQDKEGFLWFGAIQGLARYDGYTVKTYLHNVDDPHSLSHNWVKSLLLDNNGQLWAVTYSGLCQYLDQNDHFDCIKLPGSDIQSSFYALFRDSQNHYWVSTGSGILWLDIEQRRFIEAPQAIVQALRPSKDSEDNFVHEMAEDSKGNLWFALEGNGLVRFNTHTSIVTHFKVNAEDPTSLPDNKIRALLVDSNDNLWIGSLGGGISRFNTSTSQFTHFKHSGSEKADTVWEIMEDTNGMLWIGDGTGMHIYDPNTGDFADYTYSDGNNSGPGNFVARDMFLDDAGGIWVGYFPSGVDAIDMQASQFLNYNHNPSVTTSLADGGVLSTLEAPNGDIWVGCGFGLSLLDRKTGQFQRFSHDQSDPTSISGSTVLDMAIDNTGTLWIGAWDRGLNRHIPGTNHFKHYVYDTNDPHSLYGREPWSTLVAADGTLWVSTEKGINRYRPETDDFQRLLPFDDNNVILDSVYTRHLFQDRNGIIWVASFNGLYALDPKKNEFIQHYRHNPNDASTVSSDQILTVFEDHDGDIWVGTNGNGLNLLDREQGTFKRFSAEDGLPNPTITGITEDNDGALWLSTYQGLARYNKKSASFSTFDKRDGPIGNLYNRNSPSRLRSGELVFGSSRGLTIFNPKRLHPNTHVPPVVITEFSIFNKAVSPGDGGPLQQAITQTKSIELTHEQSVFSFEFAALSFRSPEENQYAYRMNGFERNWNFVGNRRSATYTNLDPGEYFFEVKGSNNSAVWSQSSTAIKVTVAPPFWRSPLAYVLYGFAFIGVIARSWAVHKAKLAGQRKSLEQERALTKRLKEIDVMKDEINRELDKKVAERTEELRQEHERLIATQEELQGLNEKLAGVSVTDQLTGLKNRRFLHQSIGEDTAIVTRQYAHNPNLDSQDDLTFLLLDLDKFKNVNDRYGHSVGDEVLVQLAKILTRVLRESDYIVRWGGEEFVIVIRYLPRSQVATIVERLIAAVKHHAFVINDELTLHQTCSIGIAAFPFFTNEPKLTHWEQVVNLADKALYCAKASGRDCWVWIESTDNTQNAERLLTNIENQGLSRVVADQKLIINSSLPKDKLVWQ